MAALAPGKWNMTKTFRLIAWGIVAFQVLAALFTPAPMKRVDSGAPLRGAHAFVSEVRVPGTSLGIHPRMGGISVEADDGGGAGVVLLPTGVRLGDESVIAIEQRSADVIVVRVKTFATAASYYVTSITPDGVRTDDSFTARILGRTWRFVLLIALVALLVGTSVIAKRRQASTTPASRDDALS